MAELRRTPSKREQIRERIEDVQAGLQDHAFEAKHKTEDAVDEAKLLFVDVADDVRRGEGRAYPLKEALDQGKENFNHAKAEARERIRPPPKVAKRPPTER